MAMQTARIKTYEQLQEFVADAGPSDHWLLCDSEDGGDSQSLSELLDTGSVTLHLHGRHFVVALLVQEVDENGQAKSDDGG